MPLFKPSTFSYYIDLDERGSFFAHVENSAGTEVFRILAGEELPEDETSIFEDGYMKHKEDLTGLKDYLITLGIMKPNQNLVFGK